MAGKADIVDHIAGSVDGLTKKAAGEAFDAAIEAIGKALKKGDRVQVPGFGSLRRLEACRAQGPQPRDRRDDHHQGQQERPLQGGQGAEGRPEQGPLSRVASPLRTAGGPVPDSIVGAGLSCLRRGARQLTSRSRRAGRGKRPNASIRWERGSERRARIQPSRRARRGADGGRFGQAGDPPRRARRPASSASRRRRSTRLAACPRATRSRSPASPASRPPSAPTSGSRSPTRCRSIASRSTSSASPRGCASAARVVATARTGAEMEALVACAAAALALYDMVKAVERGATVTDLRLEAKSGGARGDWTRGG